MLTEQQKRTRRIGGSSAAAVLGLSKYKTQLDEYKRMIGEPQEDIDNVHIRFGNLAEPIIGEIFSERYNKKLFRSEDGFVEDYHDHVYNGMGGYIHNDYDFITVNPDFESEEDGELWFNEIKTADKWVANQFGIDGTDSVPQEYNVQCHHHFFFNRYQRGRLVVLFVPFEIKELCVSVDLDDRQLKAILEKQEMHVYEFVKDEDFLKKLLDGYTRFMWHVDNKIPPCPKDFKEFSDTVRADGTEKKLDAGGERIIIELEEAETDQQIAKQRVELAKAKMAMYLDKSETLVDKEGKKLYTYKDQASKFDAEKFIMDNPELAIKYGEPGIDAKLLKAEMPQVYKKYQGVTRVLRRCK